MEMEELDRQILDRVYGAPEEEVFVSGDFLDLGDTYMVNQALARLTHPSDRETLERAAAFLDGQDQ